MIIKSHIFKLHILWTVNLLTFSMWETKILLLVPPQYHLSKEV